MKRIRQATKIIKGWLHGSAYYEDSIILGIITLAIVYAIEIFGALFLLKTLLPL